MTVLINEYKRIQYLIDSLVLPFIKSQHPKWRELILTYLEYLDENALFKTMNILDNVNVNKMYTELLDDFLDFYFKDVVDLNKFGLNENNKRLFIALSKLIHNLKSTVTSFGFFFNSFTDFSIPTASGDINVNDLTIELKENENWWLINNDQTRPFTYIFKIDVPDLTNLRELIETVHPAGWVRLFLFETGFEDYMTGYDCFELDIHWGVYYNGKYSHDGIQIIEGDTFPLLHNGGYIRSDDINCGPSPRYFNVDPLITFDAVSGINIIRDFVSSPSMTFDMVSEIFPAPLALNCFADDRTDDTYWAAEPGFGTWSGLGFAGWYYWWESPSLLVINTIGTWFEGYRPARVRLSRRDDETCTIILKDTIGNNIIDSVTKVIGPTGTDFDINWQGFDMDQFRFIGNQQEMNGIEFFTCDIEDYISETSDGSIQKFDPVWATARDSVSADAVSVNNTREPIRADFTTGYAVWRLFFIFDLSTTAFTELYSARLTLDAYSVTKSEAEVYLSVQASGATAPFVVTDFNNFSGNQFVDSPVAADIAGFDLEFNADGISFIESNLGSSVALCVREYTYDVNNIPPTSLNFANIRTAEESSIEFRPHLKIAGQ